MKKKNLIVALGLLPLFTATGMAQRMVTIVPRPQEVHLTGEAYVPSGTELTLRISGMEGAAAEIIAGQLARAYDERFMAGLEKEEGRRPDIWVGIPAGDPAFMDLAVKKGLVPGGDLGMEGYRLRIEKNRVYITANGPAGAFYGVQSLKQLLRGNPDPLQVPALEVRDWPQIGFRCVMDDISRGPIPTDAFLKQQVRRYAEMKINRMSFYIEHVVETKKHPDIAPAEGGIPVEEFSRLSEYAAGYQMELVGNFQSLGHFEKILSLPQYRYLGATDRMLDPLNPEALEFLSDMYTEMAPAFSSDWFTPNLDEAWDLSRGELKGPAADLGPARIYARHVTRIDSMLRALGKRAFVWEDIALEHPEILEMIPHDIIMGAWNYDAADSFAKFIDPLTSAGFDFIVTPGVLNSRRLIPDFNVALTNIRNFITEGYEKGALGVYCTVWDDGGMHFFSHDWYGVAYDAEQSWKPDRELPAAVDFDQRFSRGIYGDMTNTIPRALHALNEMSVLGPTYEMNANVFYKALVPARGGRVTFDPDAWTGVEKWAGEAEKILENARTPFYSGDLDYIRFTTRQYLFMARSRKALLQAAEDYDRACALQLDDRPLAMEELEEAREITGGLGAEMDRLAGGFLALWDRENRTYWRDRAEMDFSSHQEAFANQAELLDRAISLFAGGSSLPPPTEVRLDIRQRKGQYFQYWLLTGSFPILSFDEVLPDFLVPVGGEAMARPFPGMTFTDTTGMERRWFKYDSPLQGSLDFTTVFEPKTTAVAYAYCTIDAPEAMKVTALLGSNDGATVWCNGREVYHFHGKRSLIPDEDAFTLDLNGGRNYLLIKVEQWKGAWGLSFRLKDVDVRNHKQKYYIQ